MLIEEAVESWKALWVGRLSPSEPLPRSADGCSSCGPSPFARAAEFPAFLPHWATHSLVLEFTARWLLEVDAFRAEHVPNLLHPDAVEPRHYESDEHTRSMREYHSAVLELICIEIRLCRAEIWSTVRAVV
ncbi:hypothetical protein [Rathayibacter sp. Leaf296]|uniref:hypothetical protein n=1 Tax=Rathayibacter sp. Leaf296 TaxID=1736327 RepID=UPI0007032D24|nr:hypothetical protein [Rathayibacter sp. Leaf296]KQQ07553.1 hypothetical protein ASF46_18110 [Rathayibacter sp. Leaf296]